MHLRGVLEAAADDAGNLDVLGVEELMEQGEDGLLPKLPTCAPASLFCNIASHPCLVPSPQSALVPTLHPGISPTAPSSCAC